MTCTATTCDEMVAQSSLPNLFACRRSLDVTKFEQSTCSTRISDKINSMPCDLLVAQTSFPDIYDSYSAQKVLQPSCGTRLAGKMTEFCDTMKTEKDANKMKNYYTIQNQLGTPAGKTCATTLANKMTENCDKLASETNLGKVSAYYKIQNDLDTEEGRKCATKISKKMNTVIQMSTELRVRELLNTYNRLIQLNTPEANQMAATIAAQINTLVQRNLDQPPSIELSKDMQALLTLQKDTQVLAEQEQYKTFLLVFLLSILLFIVYFLIFK